jgi:hypothetical protein
MSSTQPRRVPFERAQRGHAQCGHAQHDSARHDRE